MKDPSNCEGRRADGDGTVKQEDEAVVRPEVFGEGVDVDVSWKKRGRFRDSLHREDAKRTRAAFTPDGRTCRGRAERAVVVCDDYRILDVICWMCFFSDLSRMFLCSVSFRARSGL